MYVPISLVSHLRPCPGLVCPLSSATRQRPRSPSRPGPPSIAGQVLSDDEGARPVRRAVVTLAGDVRAGLSAITDDDGRFVFGQLAAGHVTVTATRPGYLPAAYGAIRPGRPGTPLVLAAGQRATIVMRMARGGVVTGVVADQHGAPLPDVEVEAIPLKPGARLAGLVEVRATDDRGVYRIYGLLPGDYLVRARTTSVQLFSGAGPVGARTASEMDALLASLAQRNNPASVARIGVPSSAVPLAPSRPVGLAPTYFPGTTFVDEAAAVTVRAGEERSGLDFAVTPTGVATLDGVVSGSVQNLAVVQLSISALTQRGVSTGVTTPSLSRRPSESDGHFTFTNIVPGRYRILAKANPDLSQPTPTAAVRFSGVRSNADAPPGGNFVYAAADIETRGEDLSGLNLVLQPGSRCLGRLRFDGSAHQSPADLSGIRLNLAPPGTSGFIVVNGTVIGNSFGPVGAPRIEPDGTFAITGIGPGAYVLNAQLPQEWRGTWTLRSAMSRGRDLLDSPMEFAPGTNIDDLVLTFSDRHTRLSGVLSSRFRPARDRRLRRGVFHGPDSVAVRLAACTRRAAGNRWSLCHRRSAGRRVLPGGADGCRSR